MPGVQFGQQIDMNGNKITEGAAATNPTDFVILSQLTTATDGHAEMIGDGTNTSYTITHNLGLNDPNDYVLRVGEIATGAEYLVENTAISENSLSVTFGFIPALDTFRVAILPVR
jgi:hypothetical protein